ncbi:MAG TPA: carbohydrate kinase family protein [Solirubrobacteraceae bacterium]|jgi:sugar/nucleoside kinase (ribokinase family)|nr:carbohydrate kinase family protein [Solirubrobacteraceae bacterium]
MNEAVGETPRSVQTDLWVVGNVLIDLMMKGVPELPTWGEEVLATGRSEQVGGQGINLARAAARLGLSTELAAVVGDDASGDLIRATLEAEAIGAHALKTETGSTAFAVAVVRPDGERAFITDLASSASFGVEDLKQHEDAILGSRSLALVGTSNLPGIDLVAAASLLKRAQAHGVLTVFDPGWGDEITAGSKLDPIFQVTDVLLPNLDEARALTGQHDVGATLKALGERCPGTVIVTCGEEGSATRDGDTLVRIEPLAVEVDNAVGAGDVFAAGVISGLLDDGDAVAAMVRGTAATASYISRSEKRYEAIGDWRALASEVKIRCI